MGKEASLASPITAGLGAVTSVVGSVMDYKKKKKAENALNNLQTPELVNAFKDQQASTLGSDLQKQESGRNSSTAINALRGGGTRAIIGGIGAVEDNTNKVNAEIGANLDSQQKDINMNIANDNVNIRNMKESRYKDDVAGLSSQINAADDGMKQGIGNAINMATTAASAYDSARDKAKGRGNDVFSSKSPKISNVLNLKGGK